MKSGEFDGTWKTKRKVKKKNKQNGFGGNKRPKGMKEGRASRERDQ